MEEFEGNIPDIKIIHDVYFYYKCKGVELNHSCYYNTPPCDECFDCIGMNRRFAKYYEDNCRCSCGKKVDFGYFLFIYLLEKAELLPKDFKMECCNCHHWSEQNGT